ncbi:class I SAM-dependent methyltransferase [Dyadobacter bucti]|uniref:class I SAM-dependent methyltransferase n=1 Tax=Dyadobacter bucti TaxID=2572203 RepID=UPI00140A8AFE|nr:DUF4942 domain-containing protein [Dyadobacter bucti]
MFDPEFYPCSKEAWEAMNVDCYGKRVLDPSAGKGNILRYAFASGAYSVEGIEKNDELRALLSTKYPVIGSDWFQATSESISHVQMILMNPPYSNADQHILHAWNIAPEGCEIVSQCNAETINNPYSQKRKELKSLIASYGGVEHYDGAYKRAERVTDVSIAIIRLFKPVSASNEAFEGFYYDMPELNDVSGVIRYNEIQALVNNYTGAVRCFDKFADVGNELNGICKAVGFGTHGGFNYKVSSTDIDDRGHDKGEIVDKATFARTLQKKCWKIVFAKFDLEKYLTRGVMSKVNEYVESRLNYPFTMKNIFRMVETIVGTSGENMEKAIVEAVDNFTMYTDENRFNLPGWKTNAGNLLNQKFITPYICEYQYAWEGNNGVKINTHQGKFSQIIDLVKALCFLTGKDYNRMPPIGDSSLPQDTQTEILEMRAAEERRTGKYNRQTLPYPKPSGYGYFKPNTWYEWGFFRFKVFKKGTGHFEFLNIEDWARLNQAYSKAKGNPLPAETWKGFAKRKSSKEPVC